MIARRRLTAPVVPSRTWADPVLGVMMHTGDDACEAVERIPFNAAVAIDIETPGLDRSFEINCVTAAWTSTDDGQTHTALLDPARARGHGQIVEELNLRAGKIILHNAPFDIPPLYHAGLISLEQCNKITDTLLLARLCLPGDIVPKNLTALAVRLLGWTDNKGGMERAFKAAGYKTNQAGYEGMDIGSPIYRFGAMADTVATLRLESMLRQMSLRWLTDHPFVAYGATNHEAAAALIHTQETVHRVMLRRSAIGIAVDRDYLVRYRDQVATEQIQAVAELAVHGLEGGAGKGAALVRYLDERGELPSGWPRTPKGALRATKADLDGLDHPLAVAQRRLASIDKILGYLTKVDLQAAVTGRCHPQVGTLGASATGRMSYAAPELQQFPAEARPVLTDDGQGLTSIDWTTIEPVTMALMARDDEFLIPFEQGADLYAPIMRSCGVNRATAKVVLLATMYGQGTAKLARAIGHTEESAAQIKRQMFNAMKRCERWMFMVQDIAETHGRIVTAGGRILPVDPGFEYKAVNYAIQGSAYDLLAATICEMEARGIADHLQLAMHDEIVVDTEIAEEAQQIMLTPPGFLCEWARRVPVLRTDRADMSHAWAKV